MRTLIISFCFLTFSLVQVFPQDWFPVGATWYFNLPSILEWPAYGWVRYRVEQDTLFRDHQAKLITQLKVKYTGDTLQWDTLFLYEKDNRVYFWNENEFKLRYDFNLSGRDTVYISKKYYDTTFVIPVVIDSTSTTEVNGVHMKVQYVTYPICLEEQVAYNITEKIVERIGSELDFHFPYYLCGEEFHYSGMRCYNDNSLSYKSSWWNRYYPYAGCDSLIGESLFSYTYTHSSLSSIFPNPAENSITIRSSLPVVQIGFYTVLGEKYRNFSPMSTSFTINTSTFPRGAYFVLIKFSNNKRFDKHIMILK